MKQFYRLFSVLLALPLIILLFAYNSGSPGGKTGSMGDGGSTCTDCHSGSATAQTGWITSNIPAEGYTPGTTYQITATATHSGVSKLGFELTAENSSGQKTGSFTITDAARTKLANQNKAITHTAAGNSPSGSSNTWTANWTAPATDVGQIRFYAAFNAAKGNGGTSGDVIYTSTLFVNAMAPAALLSIVPNSQTQGENVTVTITGQNT
ncbi:MAG: choice-of-anchor V domain-containing protein, partial [Ignavibacteria bacterium]|nr:choice-of-anchor V domain-containing protein [Ignavibacteria bacterium]